MILEGPMPGRGTTLAGWTSWGLVLFSMACEPVGPPPVLDLPPRSDDAPGGAELVRDLRPLPVEAREGRLYSEIMAGNVPTWLRRLEPVDIVGEADGRERRLTFWTTPDYLAVGSDEDFFLVPLSAHTAQRIANLVGGSLPTTAMVDAVWEAARFRLTPIRIPPGELMGTMEYFERHDRLVQAQRGLRGVRPGAFVAGHKLDVVRPTDPAPTSGETGVYGWHLPDGERIQPLYPIPTDRPPHFSLGIRLVHRQVLADGIRRDLEEILGDPEWARFLDDGAG